MDHMLESAAMVALLADAFPEKGLAPSPGLSFARADYLQVLHSGASIDMMLWQIRIHEDILRESEKDVRTVVRYKSKFSKEIVPQLRSRLDQGHSSAEINSPRLTVSLHTVSFGLDYMDCAWVNRSIVV
jgi:glutathione S-transferase